MKNIWYFDNSVSIVIIPPRSPLLSTWTITKKSTNYKLLRCKNRIPNTTSTSYNRIYVAVLQIPPSLILETVPARWSQSQLLNLRRVSELFRNKKFFSGANNPEKHACPKRVVALHVICKSRSYDFACFFCATRNFFCELNVDVALHHIHVRCQQLGWFRYILVMATTTDTLRHRKVADAEVKNVPSDEGRKKDALLDEHNEYVPLSS